MLKNGQTTSEILRFGHFSTLSMKGLTLALFYQLHQSNCSQVFYKIGLLKNFSKSLLSNTCHTSLSLVKFHASIMWDKVFKSGPSKICGRQSLKNLNGYGLVKQTISLQTI